MAQWNKQDQAYRVQDTTNFEVVMIADEDGNPINSFGAASNIPISGGQIAGYQYIHKFGANTDLANGQYETIWDGSNLYPWATMDTAATTLTTNADALNNGAEVTIQGLNENWELTTEVLTLDGTAQTTQTLWSRVFRAYCSGSQALGAVFTLSKGATVVLQVSIEAQQTLMSPNRPSSTMSWPGFSGRRRIGARCWIATFWLSTTDDRPCEPCLTFYKRF